MQTKQQSPLLRIWEMGESGHPGLIRSMISAAAGVLCGMLPYLAAAQIIIGLLSGVREGGYYLRFLLLALIGYGLRTVLYALALSMSHRATFSILKELRIRILEKLPRMPLGTIMDTSSGRLKQIIVDQVEGMERTLAHLLPEMTANLLGPLAILVYLFVLDWRMALAALVSIPIGFSFMMLVMRGYSEDYEGSVRVSQEMNRSIIEYIGGIEVIKAFNQGQNSYARFAGSVRANAQYFYDWMKRCQFPMSLAYAVAPATGITVLPVGWFLYQSGSLPADTFITTVILSLGIVGPLIAAMSFIDNLAKIGTTVSEIDGILSGQEQVHRGMRQNQERGSHSGGGSVGRQGISGGKAPAFSPAIEVSHVSFGYHEGKEILHDVSLSIPAGSLTAFVGPSGGGKSTIAKLIAGFWDVEQGEIRLGGVPEKEIPLEQLYAQVAFVSQDNYLFDDTVRENIRMGRTGATDAEVEDVARAAGCDSFIRALDKGYETRVGGGGAHLSGGERQRIAIARAMLKDAPIVILDEATAYMDPENEALMQEAVGRLIAGKTVIVIAHRLSTITGADQIFVVRDGQIEAHGAHEELLHSCPLYADMWRAHRGTAEEEGADGRTAAEQTGPGKDHVSAGLREQNRKEIFTAEEEGNRHA
ncbi:MAG: ABC transporter ATP-binding protein [Eubacteriales bacterium]|nr:ABC transporter ATP-binding protein [Eubacteriales bacterium]